MREDRSGKKDALGNDLANRKRGRFFPPFSLSREVMSARERRGARHSFLKITNRRPLPMYK